jgi:putative SOS response-associated peptidase YedK
MCGRFTLAASPTELAALFDLDGASLPALAPRYNIAPTQSIAAVRAAPADGRRELVLLRWGFIPAWAKDPSGGAPLINARSETAADKPTFRAAFRRRRCLVPADGFFEWHTENGKKQPYYFTLADGAPFAIAGLWERWQAPTGDVVESCTLLTTEANDLVRPLHDRMPVILAPADYPLWLDPEVNDPGPPASLLVPFQASAMAGRPVSPRVNAVRNDDPGCVEPIDLPRGGEDRP